MNTALLALVAAAAPAGPALAGIDGFVLPHIHWYERGDSPLNPGNHLGVPSRQAALAAGLRGTAAGVTWRVRAEHSSVHAQGRTLARGKLSLQELARTFALSDSLSLVAGKRVLAWDVSLSSTPLGFFQKNPDLADLTDRLERAEGLPLIALGYVGERLDLTAVYSDTLGQAPAPGRAARQAAVNLTWNHPGGAYSLILHRPDDQPLGIGLAATIALHDALTVQLSALTRRGTSRPISRRLLERNPGFDLVDPNGPWRIDSARQFSRWVLGLQWAASATTNVILEWSHDNAAPGRSEWRFWRRLVEQHAAAAMPPLADPAHRRLALANLAFDAASLEPAPARRDQLFVRVARSVGRTTFAALARTDLADGGTLLHVSLTTELTRSLAGELGVSRHAGPSGSLPDYALVGGVVQGWVKYAF